MLIATLKAHELWLCDSGAASRHYAIAIGSGGIGKQREGDGRTPVGTYPIGEPRPSRKFGTFIPILYPTAEQKKAGYTGRDVGLHGPPRALFVFSGLSTWIDWTAGCIAVSSQGKIDEIAAWVRARKPRSIDLRE